MALASQGVLPKKRTRPLCHHAFNNRLAECVAARIRMGIDCGQIRHVRDLAEAGKRPVDDADLDVVTVKICGQPLVDTVRDTAGRQIVLPWPPRRCFGGLRRRCVAGNDTLRRGRRWRPVGPASIGCGPCSMACSPGDGARRLMSL